MKPDNIKEDCECSCNGECQHDHCCHEHCSSEEDNCDASTSEKYNLPVLELDWDNLNDWD